MAPLKRGSERAQGGTPHSQRQRYARIGARPARAGSRHSSSHNHSSRDDTRDNGAAEPLGYNTREQRIQRSIQQAETGHQYDDTAALAARRGLPSRHATAQTRRDHENE